MVSSAAIRFRKKEAQWRRVVAGYAGSGLSIRVYCGRRGVPEHGFYMWRRRLAWREAELSRAAFVPVTVAGEAWVPAAAGWIEIFLPGDRRVQVVGAVDRTMLAEVLSLLERPAANRGQVEAGRC